MADILKTWQMYASQSTLLLYFSIIFFKFENDNRRHHRKSDKCTHPHCHAFLAYSQSPAFGLKFCNSALLILTCYFTKWGILSFAQGKVILAVMKQLKQLQIKPRILKEKKSEAPTGFEPMTCYTGVMLYQLSYEAYRVSIGIKAHCSAVITRHIIEIPPDFRN